MVESPYEYRRNLMKGTFTPFLILIAILLMTDTPKSRFNKNDATNQEEYLDQITLDSSTIIENTTTSKQNDYFVIDENDEIFFVTVLKNKDDLYNHELITIDQEKDTELMRNLEISTEQQNKQEKE